MHIYVQGTGTGTLDKKLPGTTVESFTADLDRLPEEEQRQRRYNCCIVEIGLHIK
jgi:hypothetical protein